MPDTPQTAETNLDPTNPYARAAQVDPRLTPEMAGRIAGYGAEERLPRGSLVFEHGQRGVDLFFILDGSIEVFDADEHGRPNVFTTHGVRQFTGEMDLFNDRRILVSGRTGTDSRVVLIGPGHAGDTLRLQRFMTRNGYPHRLLDIDADPDAAGQALSSAFTTTRAGIYAAGDIRSGSVKRVASGVGEGSAAVQAIHGFLHPIVA